MIDRNGANVKDDPFCSILLNLLKPACRIQQGFTSISQYGLSFIHLSDTMKSMPSARIRDDALAIFQAGLKAVDSANAVRKHVRIQKDILTVGDKTYDLGQYADVYVIGAGKASAEMARPLEEILGDHLRSGVVNVKYGHSRPLRRVEVNEAGHPVPDEAGLRGTDKVKDILGRTGDRDLVIFLLSGGGSALLPSPAAGLTLDDKQRLTQLLLESGADIREINAIRKHVSAVKGGQLARLAFPSTLVSLILSDVIGDRLDSIASGPTVPDGTTFSDCLRILEKYGLAAKIPPAVRDHLERGARGEVEETPKPGDPAFLRTQNLIVGSNIQALLAAREKAVTLGYNCLILSSTIEGETRDVARMHAALAREILASGHPVRRPACLISGGETTVTIHGRGLGGRNQEFALDGLDDIVVLSGGTDGTDGPTDAAGAIAGGATVGRAKALGLAAADYLRENDSYHFFKPLGDLLMTGPTLTNVMDLRLVLVG
jgi:glycerate 2-kinase